MQNSKLARSLKKGHNDHIEEIAIIKDKLVTPTVKQKSNKRPNTTLATDKSKKKRQTAEETTDKSKKKEQTEKEKEEMFKNLLEEEIVQDTIDALIKKRSQLEEKKRLRKIIVVVMRNTRNVWKT